ncbi:uncharacterized protein EI90DRAFT_1350951 [Cantharellus anzutake]|uniref:uncharacterized protein n=1 Tax=Cantharellus anzutake TaxID=1750568 RepID=UPI00190584EB|nr:uncharacterized protein EI90DRAFT_1350951 [Cantharellus anzutake]KAF8329830.1 hypothetical protein EI90DRAFT_1350951 [Cantharellus anzutake]
MSTSTPNVEAVTLGALNQAVPTYVPAHKPQQPPPGRSILFIDYSTINTVKYFILISYSQLPYTLIPFAPHQVSATEWAHNDGLHHDLYIQHILKVYHRFKHPASPLSRLPRREHVVLGNYAGSWISMLLSRSIGRARALKSCTRSENDLRWTQIQLSRGDSSARTASTKVSQINQVTAIIRDSSAIYEYKLTEQSLSYLATVGEFSQCWGSV